jgi:hypothetical protein
VNEFELFALHVAVLCVYIQNDFSCVTMLKVAEAEEFSQSHFSQGKGRQRLTAAA